MTTCEKDLYTVLGVSSAATPEDILSAYRSRIRIAHPDRFDKDTQPLDWRHANQMLAELNEAFAVLSQERTRAEYDRRRPNTRHVEDEPLDPFYQDVCSTSTYVIDLGELTAGKVKYGDLSLEMRERLRSRQDNTSGEHFRHAYSSVRRNYFFIAMLLCWFSYVGAARTGAEWSAHAWMWFGGMGISVAVGALISCNLIRIAAWRRSTLKSYYYVTPLYFVKTGFDIAEFRPLWDLKDIGVVHHFTNGSYQNSKVVLKFDDKEVSLTLS